MFNSCIDAYADHTANAGHFTALDGQRYLFGIGNESEKKVTSRKVHDLLQCSSAGQLALNQPSLSSQIFYLPYLSSQISYV
jgi:hypothetical protein